MINKRKQKRQTFEKKGVKESYQIYHSIIINWDSINKVWDIQKHKSKLISNQKNLMSFWFPKLNKMISFHQDCFEFKKILYPTDDTFMIYSDIKWAATSLKSSLYFIEDQDDIYKGFCVFYRNLKFLEMSEKLKGNKKQQIFDKSQLSHGLFLGF
jgi:hypothetical protein